MAAVLQCENLSVERGGTVLLSGFDCEVADGSLVGVVGDNGSGKTTLCRTIAQLNRPVEGEIRVAGFATRGPDAARARQHTGFVPHEPHAWANLSVRRNLEYAYRLAGEQTEVGVGEALERWQLAEVADKPVDTLSRGWRQRYSLARADRPHVRLFILDEPTTGLDAAATAAFTRALERWRRQGAVLVVSHDRAWLAGVADETWTLGVGGE